MMTFPFWPEAVLFDHDGVLVQSEPLHWAAWQQLLHELSIPYSEPELQRLVGKTAPEILKFLLDRHKPGWQTSQPHDLNALALRKNDFYLEKVSGGLKAYPGVPEGLAWLKSQGVPMAVVSNAKDRELDASLSLLGIARYFEVVVSRDHSGTPKPDPKHYLYAAEQMGVDPTRCIAIEDSPTGIEACLRAKIPSVAVLTHFTEEEMRAPVRGRPELRPVAFVQSMQEFFELLRKAKK